MAAIGLIKGNLTAADYEDEVAADPRIDALRAKMVCVENKQWTRDKQDGSRTDNMAVEYPVGHRRRRKEGVPLLEAKFRTNLARCLAPKQQAAIVALCGNQKRLEATTVHQFMDLFVV